VLRKPVIPVRAQVLQWDRADLESCLEDRVVQDRPEGNPADLVVPVAKLVQEYPDSAQWDQAGQLTVRADIPGKILLVVSS
jgi:hypothetical protein